MNKKRFVPKSPHKTMSLNIWCVLSCSMCSFVWMRTTNCLTVFFFRKFIQLQYFCYVFLDLVMCVCVVTAIVCVGCVYVCLIHMMIMYGPYLGICMSMYLCFSLLFELKNWFLSTYAFQFNHFQPYWRTHISTFGHTFRLSFWSKFVYNPS